MTDPRDTRIAELEAVLAAWIAPGTVYEVRRNNTVLDLHALTRAILTPSSVQIAALDGHIIRAAEQLRDGAA